MHLCEAKCVIESRVIFPAPMTASLASANDSFQSGADMSLLNSTAAKLMETDPLLIAVSDRTLLPADMAFVWSNRDSYHHCLLLLQSITNGTDALAREFVLLPPRELLSCCWCRRCHNWFIHEFQKGSLVGSMQTMANFCFGESDRRKVCNHFRRGEFVLLLLLLLQRPRQQRRVAVFLLQR
jgi:hypothetical protein